MNYVAILALSFALFIGAASATAEPITSLADFKKTGESERRVLVLLKDPKRVERKSEPKGWVNFNDHIANLQDQAVSELGWRNFNDVVRLASEPVLAKKVSEREMQQLLSSDRVEGIYVDTPMSRSLAQSKIAIGQDRINLNMAGYSGTLAIIDDGIDKDHPFFRNNSVVDEACFSQSGECHNDQTAEFGPDAAMPCDHGCDHGTHVAGIAAGGPNSDMTGVAGGAKLLVVNVFPTGSYASTTDILLGLEWILSKQEEHGVTAVNMSLGNGSQHYPDHCDQRNPIYGYVIDKLRAANIAVVIASGNESNPTGISLPACLQGAISVGSLEKDGSISEFSNNYAALDLYAPGGEIVSSVNHGEYSAMSGTSMAAPQVAGAWVALSAAFPNASYDEKLAALRVAPKVIDPRSPNKFAAPSLRLDQAFAYLQNTHGAPQSQQPSQPPRGFGDNRKAPVEDSKQKSTQEKRVDGILIRSESNNSGKIDWR
jgi:subtilisin family serine protease